MNDIILRQGEQKVLKLIFKNKKTGAIISLTGAIFKLVIKKNNTVVTKNDSDFDKTLAIQGIIKVTLTQEDLNQDVGIYGMAIKTIFSDGSIDKSRTFTFSIQESIIKD